LKILKYWLVLVILINWLLKPKCMLKLFFFLSRCNMIFFIFLERLGRMHENKIFIIIIFLMSWWKPGILIPDLYLYSIKIQIDIDQNAVKTLQKKITYFFEILFEEFFLGWAQPDPCGGVGPSKPGRVTGPSQWPDWLLNASVREQFTHACCSDKVIKLQLHNICAIINIRKRNEKLTWFTAAAGRNPS